MTTLADEAVRSERVVLGDEAVALAALHAGITAAYAYPGTPSTEIQETLIKHASRHGSPRRPGVRTRRPPTSRPSASRWPAGVRWSR